MKISLNWLRRFVNTDWSAVQISDLLTDLGLEVEGIHTYESIPGMLDGMVVGEVLTCEKHPNADKLKVTSVDVGEDEPLSIVCGAPNVDKGQKVVVATVGSTIYPIVGEPFKIKKAKIRDHVSMGMICAEDEIGIGQSHDGIIVLDDKYKPGTPCKEVFLPESDQIFEIGLTPNRADAMSHMGVARDLKAGWLQQGIQMELITPSINDFHIHQSLKPIRVDVIDAKAAPRYCGVRISGISVGPSPAHIQNKLKAIGLSPINNVVDATNYILHEIGQPLHAFDAKEITSNTVKVKTLPKGTTFTTLDGVERKLHEEDLMICDGDKPMCIAGVFGGIDSGITEKTKEVFLESAYFDPVRIRKTAKRHGLSTDASFRFERGIDIQLCDYALKRAALLIMEVAGGKITSEISDDYPTKVEQNQLTIQFDYINKLIGQEIPREEIKSILTSLGIKINNVSETTLGLSIPSYRVDVTRPADIVEEILRVYGYNRINFSDRLITSMPTGGKPADQEVRMLSQQLANLGFFEIYNNSLTKLQENENDKSVSIVNPLSQELSAMRTSLFGGLVDAIQYNRNRKNNNCRFFEIGNVYQKDGSDYIERKQLVIGLTGMQQENHWRSNEQSNDFFYLKGIIEALCKRAGIVYTENTLENQKYLNEGISLQSGQKEFGSIGKLDTTAFEGLSIENEVFVAEIDIEAYKALATNTAKHIQAISKFPSVNRDLALIVNRDISYESLQKATQETEKKLVTSIQLFDVYEGKGIPEGKKSYGLSFTLNDNRKTLTDKQVDKL
ncbi:MAG: phenylalanine--tRNA ligase subunit beta [Flavobacteriaceae bacterium]|nr:phenylalanine--tRNA ligase subunit beta [Flavobacteriaceae bacterium]